MKCPECQTENESFAASCVKCGRGLTPPRRSPHDALTPGTVFDSRYEIVSTLGRGGMGTVYKARDLVLDEIVAIKVLRSEYALDPKMATRFKTEIKLARKVRHKNVCSIHDYGEYEGFLYISMEFIEGVDLKRILKEKGAPPFDEAYRLAIQVAQGLQAVHDAGIIHRDLKASNIMCDKDGVVRLMDFGVAKQYGAKGGTITSTGQVVGTPEYMSPEQAQGHKLDFRSDVYALGVLVYELFTGQVPFRGDTPISTILKHIHEAPPIYGPRSSKVPAPLVPILRRALAKNPKERQSTVRAVVEELKRASREQHHPASTPTAMQEGTTLLAPTPASAAAAQPGKSRGLPRTWFLALAAICIAVGAVWMIHFLTSSAEPKQVETADASASRGPAVGSNSGGETAGEDGTAAAVSLPSSEIVPTPTTSVATSTVPVTTQPTTSVRAPRSTTSTAPAPTSTTSLVPTSVTTTTSSPAKTTAAVVGKGWLQIAVKPWAEVRVDGKLIGTTPLDRINVDAGSHTVSVRHPDYEILEKSIKVQPDQTEKLFINLLEEGKKKQ
jgi:serine/threonine protein kinase